MKNIEDLFADTENTWDYPDEEDFYIDTQYAAGTRWNTCRRKRTRTWRAGNPPGRLWTGIWNFSALSLGNFRWIGVNAAFITVDDFERKLQDLPSVQKILVYGTSDDEYNVIFPALASSENESQKMRSIEGVDHRFSGMLPQFMQTIDLVDDIG